MKNTSGISFVLSSSCNSEEMVRQRYDVNDHVPPEEEIIAEDLKHFKNNELMQKKRIKYI